MEISTDPNFYTIALSDTRSFLPGVPVHRKPTFAKEIQNQLQAQGWTYPFTVKILNQIIWEYGVKYHRPIIFGPKKYSLLADESGPFLEWFNTRLKSPDFLEKAYNKYQETSKAGKHHYQKRGQTQT
jgi:hypothetical protein